LPYIGSSPFKVGRAPGMLGHRPQFWGNAESEDSSLNPLCRIGLSKNSKSFHRFSYILLLLEFRLFPINRHFILERAVLQQEILHHWVLRKVAWLSTPPLRYRNLALPAEPSPLYQSYQKTRLACRLLEMRASEVNHDGKKKWG
jgi:hypothetical protein